MTDDRDDLHFKSNCTNPNIVIHPSPPSSSKSQVSAAGHLDEFQRLELQYHQQQQRQPSQQSRGDNQTLKHKVSATLRHQNNGRPVLRDKTNQLPSRLFKPMKPSRHAGDMVLKGKHLSSKTSTNSAFERKSDGSGITLSTSGLVKTFARNGSTMTQPSAKRKAYLKDTIMELHRGRAHTPVSQKNETSVGKKEHIESTPSTNSGDSKGLKLTALSAIVKKTHTHDSFSSQASTNSSAPVPSSLPSANTLTYKTGYNLITKDILDRVPYACIDKSASISEQASTHIRNLIDWYKVNKLSNVIPCPDIDALILKAHEHLHNLEIGHTKVRPTTVGADITNLDTSLLSLTSQRPNLMEFKPQKFTHIVQRATKIGRYLISVTVVNIRSNEKSTALLTLTDERVEVLTNDLLFLKKDFCSTQAINCRPMPVYTIWFVYKKNPLDVDFFK